MKPLYIIAEIGLNHGGDLLAAESMIRHAAKAGANAAKFQYVKADKLVSKSAPTYFRVPEDHNPPLRYPRKRDTQHGFFARSDALGREDYEYLAKVCASTKVDFLCTVFDVESVHWIAPLVPAFKVASADITNIPLLEAIASYKKPVFLSTGAATTKEIRTAARTIGPGLVTLLHCVLSYPTPLESANLEMVLNIAGGWPWLSRDDPMAQPHNPIYPAGYSDHTLFNLDVLTTAWLLGATVIEKHFTLDKTLPGNDHYHSMDPADLRSLVAKFKELQAMIGDGEKRVLPIEETARLNARQSWHATQDLDAGQCLVADMVTLKRPGTGCPPSMNMVGRILGRAVRADEPITRVAVGVLA